MTFDILSILYLRCTTCFICLMRMSKENYLSILYLRCGKVVEKLTGRPYDPTFNSLFEMPNCLSQ